jgi:DedD protein
VPAARSDESARAKALTGAKPAAAAVSPRFVVQVGAFEHAAAAHDTRGKVEKLGLKAYEQEIEAGGSRRIRVRLGPFASREEAERTLQKLRASGMTASVMPL